MDFAEYEVEKGRDTYERMLEFTGGNRKVPAVFEKGQPVQ